MNNKLWNNIQFIISFTFTETLSPLSYINNNNSNDNNHSNNNKKEDERKHKIYAQNPYNGVICNDIILATGVFSSKELWILSKGNYFNYVV